MIYYNYVVCTYYVYYCYLEGKGPFAQHTSTRNGDGGGYITLTMLIADAMDILHKLAGKS